MLQLLSISQSGIKTAKEAESEKGKLQKGMKERGKGARWGHLQSVGLSCPLGEATFATLEPLFMQIKTVAHGPLHVSFLPSPPPAFLSFTHSPTLC